MQDPQGNFEQFINAQQLQATRESLAQIAASVSGPRAGAKARSLSAAEQFEDTTWGGLRAILVRRKDGSHMAAQPNELLKVSINPKYVLTSAQGTKLYSIADGTAGRFNGVSSIVASFQPR
jgi:hypothetical protein